MPLPGFGESPAVIPPEDSLKNGQHGPPTGDHKGPPFPAPPAIAPTDVDVLGFKSCYATL
jgi:hypothetical protein